MNQKGFIAPPLLALIAILVLGGGAYVYVQKKQANPPVTANSTAQTATWNTHKNTKYNYEIKYPDTWMLDNGATGELSAPDQPRTHFQYNPNTGGGLHIDVNPYPHEENRVLCSNLVDCAGKYDSFYRVNDDGTKIERQNIKFSGVDAIQDPKMIQPGGWIHLRTFLFHDNNFIVIDFSEQTINFESRKIEYEQILSTFKFTK